MIARGRWAGYAAAAWVLAMPLAAPAQIGEMPGLTLPLPQEKPALQAPPGAVVPAPPGIRVIPLPGSPAAARTDPSPPADTNIGQATPAPPPAAVPSAPANPPAAPETVTRERSPRDPFAERAPFEDRRYERRLARDWRRALGPFAIAPLCDPDLWRYLEIYLRVVEQAVRPNEAQRTALDSLRRSGLQAEEEARATCGADIDTAPAARLAAAEARLASVLQAIRTVRPALDSFVASLNEEQRERFDAIGESVGRGERRGRRHGRRGWRW